MRLINARAGLAILAILTAFKIAAVPLSPEAWGLEAGQTTLFNGGRYYLILAQPVGNYQFQAIGVDTRFNVNGTYEFGGFEIATPKSGFQAVAQVTAKDMSITYDYVGITFSTNNSGSPIIFYQDIGGQFTTSMAYDNYFPPSNPLPGPLGNMLRAHGTAPINPNVTYTLTVTDGNAPFANSGNFVFAPAADGTYAITLPSSKLATRGTYSYAVTNTVAGCFNMTDSLKGHYTTYFCYYTPTNGFFMLTQTNGGYQVGTFVASGILLPAFFNGSIDLANNVSWLQFPDGNLFGYYNAVDFNFPLFYHYDMGFEWFIDANNAAHGAYLYDFSSSTFFYTEPNLFPYLYDFTLNSWIYYFADTNNPGHYTSNPRWFYDFKDQQFINK